VVSSGLTLLSVLLAVIGAGMMEHQLLEPDVGRWPELSDFFGRLFPDTSLMMVLIAAIFLWAALTPSARATREPDVLR
jgi:hypothetical protein